MYDDESMDDREIANGNWIISFKVTPRFIESSRAEEGEKRGMDVRLVLVRSDAIFCVTPLPPVTFIFLPPLLILFTLYFPR